MASIDPKTKEIVTVGRRKRASAAKFGEIVSIHSLLNSAVG